MANEELVYVGIKGQVVALSCATGEIRWSANLGTGFLNTGAFVHVVVDGDCLYATTQGEISCLDAATGRFRWRNPLKGYGLGIASIAVRNCGSPANLAAEAAAQEQGAAVTATSAGH
jgi:outer membrane protein assembly factor BamB